MDSQWILDGFVRPTALAREAGEWAPTTAFAGAAASNIARPGNAVHSVSWVTLPVRLVRLRRRRSSPFA
jgi:hypothetical protein